MKEVTKVIKVGGTYYGLIKPEAGKENKQDYLKFSDPSKQLKIVYDRYLRVGFKRRVDELTVAPKFIDVINTNVKSMIGHPAFWLIACLLPALGAYHLIKRHHLNQGGHHD